MLHFDKFDNPENSIIRNFSREPKRPDYRDMTVYCGNFFHVGSLELLTILTPMDLGILVCE